MATITVKPDSSGDQVVIEIPPECVVVSINPRGDATFITIQDMSPAEVE
jgi:hypothetical protein